MCKIVILKPDVQIDRPKFDNMCWNNWHSWGLVTMLDGQLDVKKVVADEKTGEYDHDELWEALHKDSEFLRVLHVRHNTAGATTMDNCHPIPVLSTNERDVYFMHNGTMPTYKSQKWVSNSDSGRNYAAGGTWEDDDTGPSDTKNFVDSILQPYLSSMDFGNGHGDYSDPLFVKLITTLWPLNNRGLLLAKDQKFLKLGPWQTVKNSKGQEMEVSNNDYFETVKRGPEFSRREEAKKIVELKAAKSRTVEKGGSVTSGSTSIPNIVKLSDVRFHQRTTGYELPTTLKNILTDYNVWDRESAVSLGMATRDELTQLYHDKETCLTVMDWIFADYYSVFSEKEKLEEKNKKQQDILNELYAKEVKENKKGAANG